jgi:DNA (cytosine-5)-methyltransferase 1
VVGLVLIGSYRQQWAIIGNSVPPLFMKAIAEHVRKLFI